MHPEIHLGSWSIPSYFLIISLDFCLLLLWLRKRSESNGFSARQALDIGILSSIAGLVGARLFHVFYEYPEYYLQSPTAILNLWEGGYVFMAGVASGLLTGCVLVFRSRTPLLPWLDLFAPILGIGYSLGRWACFFQGCCYGKITNSPLGVHFEGLGQAGEALPRYPTQIFTSINEMLLVVVLLWFERSKRAQLKPGILFCCWLVGHGLNRMLMELLRDDPRGPLVFGLGVSFWIAMVFSLLGLVASIAILKGVFDQSSPPNFNSKTQI